MIKVPGGAAGATVAVYRLESNIGSLSFSSSTVRCNHAFPSRLAIPPSVASTSSSNSGLSSRLRRAVGLVVISPVSRSISNHSKLLDREYIIFPLIPVSASVAVTWNTLVPAGAFSFTEALSLSGLNTGELSFSSSTFTMSSASPTREGDPPSLAWTLSLYSSCSSLSKETLSPIWPVLLLTVKTPRSLPWTIL